MPFRLWLYLGKVGGLALFLVIFLTFGADSGSLRHQVCLVATWILVPLCLTGAVMGVLMVLGKLRMRCPFCGRSGPAGGSKADGMWMECESCGLIRCVGRLGLTIVKDSERANDEGEEKL